MNDPVRTSTHAESVNNEAPKRDTPTEFARKLALAHASRQPVKASEEVEITRNAKGDYQYTVSGVAGEEEDLSKVSLRVLAVAIALDEKLPLSRSQHEGRNYTSNEKAEFKRVAK